MRRIDSVTDSMGTSTWRSTLTQSVCLNDSDNITFMLPIGDPDMAQAFLGFPCSSKRYPSTDMWYHVPRALAKLRGWDFLINDGAG